MLIVLLAALPALLLPAANAAAADITPGEAFNRVQVTANARCFKVPPNSDDDVVENAALDFSGDITADAQATATTDDCGTDATNLPRATARAQQTATVTAGPGGLSIVSKGLVTGRTQRCSGNQNHNARADLSRIFTVSGGPVDYTLSGSGSGQIGDQFRVAFAQIRLLSTDFPDQTFGGGTQSAGGCGVPVVPESFSHSGTLNPGQYEFQVTAQCQGTGSSTGGHPSNTDGCHADWDVRLDVGTPQTLVAISSGPSGLVSQNTANFEFTALSPPPGRFECRVDGGSFTPCSSPLAVGPLADGEHVLEVLYHPDGEDPGPATERRWTIDTTAPAAVIDSAPSGNNNGSSAQVFFHSTEPDGATFLCKLDDGPELACSSPHSLAGLTDGPHTFSVVALDRAGNRSVAASAGWTVDTRNALPAVVCPGDTGTAGFGPVRLVARAADACFVEGRVEGREALISLGQVTLNGITLTPAAGSRIIVAQRLGGGTVRVDGPVTVRFGTLPQVLGARPVEASLASLDLDDLAASSVRATRILSFAEGVLAMAGLPVVPGVNVELSPDNGGQAKVTFRVGLPKVAFKRGPNSNEGVTVEVSPTFSNNQAVTFAGRLKVAQAFLFGKKVKDLDMAFDFGTMVFEGSVGIALESAEGTPLAEKTLTGTIAVGAPLDNCGVRKLGLAASNLNRPVGPGVLLQRFGGTFECVPDGGNFSVKLAANGGVSAGPRIAIGSFETEAASVDGTVTLTVPVTSTSPLTLKVEGAGKLVDFPVAQQAVEYTAPATIKLTGGVDLTIGGYGAELTYGEGTFVAGTTFNVEAAGRANLFLVEASAQAVFSSVGFAVCIGDGDERTGFGRAWNGELTAFVVCDVSQFRATAAQAGAEGFEVPRGLPLTVVAAHGEGAPPKVVLAGPGGERVETPAGPEGISNRDVMLVQDTDADITYVALFNPSAGRWSVSAADGSARLTSVRVARKLPPVRVSARVSGRGAKRQLRWRARRLDGQRLQLIERSRGGAHLLTTTRRASGRLRFTPDPLLGSRRTIEAIVFNGPTPRATSTVARFSVPPLKRPGRVRGVRLRRGVLSWRRQAVAAAYEVAIVRPDQTTASRTVRRPRLRIGGLPRRGTLRVSVVGVNAAGRAGPIARARFALGGV